MKKRRKTLLIIGIALILIAVLLAIAFEKAMNSVLPPEMVKELLKDENLNKELGDLINDENVFKDVQSIVYNQNKLADVKSQSDNTGFENSQKNSETQAFKTQEKSGNVTSNNVSQSNLNKNSPKDEEQTSSSQTQDKLNISTADQLEAAKIVLSVMSMAEIKELVSLYRSGKKTEAIQRGIGILKQRLSPEQKKRLKEMYLKYK